MRNSRAKLAGYIANKTLKSGVSTDISREVAAYLLDEGRVNELDSVLRDVQDDWAKAGHVEVVAASAHELTMEIKRDITAQIRTLYPNAKQIIITEVHDPEIIGGVRLNLANQQLDLSIESKLNRFKQLTAAGRN